MTNPAIHFSKRFFFLLIVGILVTTQLYAWPIINGVAICTAANNQEYPSLTSDGSGGAIITWEDQRNGPWNIYAQQVNGDGLVPVEDWYLYDGDRK